MSMRFTDPRPVVNYALIALLVTGCSAPMPVPPTASPVAPAPPSPPVAAAPAQDEPGKIVKVQFEQAIAFMRAGQDEKASALFANIAKLDPKLASPHTNLGILCYREGKPKEAEAAFKEALQLDAKDYVAANYLGMLYRAQGRFSDAEAAYEQALAAKPDYGYAHLNLAILYDIYLDDLPKALDHYEQYQRIDGDSDRQLTGWLADLRQRMKSTGEDPKP
jgi:tetratricopeptide (TPR) repeat protein